MGQMLDCAAKGGGKGFVIRSETVTNEAEEA
jgi:hypothetical protein